MTVVPGRRICLPNDLLRRKPDIENPLLHPTQNPCPPQPLRSTYVPPNPKAATLQPHTLLYPDEEAPRRERHLAIAQELIDLSIELTRYAAQRVRAAHEESLTSPAPQPPARDPDLTFHRLAACTRHCVALEAQIANNAFAQPASRQATPRQAATPGIDLHEIAVFLNRETIATALTHLTEHREDRQDLSESFDAIIEDTFSAFPEDPLCAHFNHACQALGIPPNLAALPARLAAEIAGTLAEEPAASPPERWPRAQAA